MINPPCLPSRLTDIIAKLDQEGRQLFAEVLSELDRLTNGNPPQPPEEIGQTINALRRKLDGLGEGDRAVFEDVVLRLTVRRSEYY